MVPPGDGSALTDAVAQLLDHQEATLKMGQQAERDMAERWNWNTYRDNLMELYRSLS